MHFDTINGKAMASAIAQSQFSEEFKTNISRSFDSLNYDVLKSAFINTLAYGKSDFDQTTANGYLQNRNNFV